MRPLWTRYNRIVYLYAEIELQPFSQIQKLKKTRLSLKKAVDVTMGGIRIT